MKRFLSTILSVLLVFCLLCGCGAAAGDYKTESSAPMVGNSSADMNYEGGEMFYDDVTEESFENPLSVGQGENHNLKIIYEANLWVETLEYDESLAALAAAIEAHGGYIQSSEQYGGYRLERDYYSSRSCTLIIRIPTDNYRPFLDSMGGVGNVISKNEYTTDITANYLDVEARLASLTAQEQRLLELLAEADTVENLLYIEDTLADVRYEIESYTSRMRTYENQLSYSTITLDLQEVRTITPTEEQGFLVRVWDAVKDSARGVVDFLDSFCIGLIYALPYLLMAGILVFVLIKLIGRGRRKRAAKKAAKLAAKAAEAEKAAEELN